MRCAGIEELSRWVVRDDWEAVLDSFARCARITRSESAQELRTDLFCEPEEGLLYKTYLRARRQLNGSANVDDFLGAFETMVPAVTEFFDNVLVHDPDPSLRNNRIALLQLISGMQAGIADLSELENF